MVEFPRPATGLSPNPLWVAGFSTELLTDGKPEPRPTYTTTEAPVIAAFTLAHVALGV